MCKNQHLEKTCQELSACENPKSCHKRHTKDCKRYEKGFCRFGIGCAYSHKEKSILKAGSNNTEIHVKVEMLENMVIELAEKIFKLESKMKETESKDVSKAMEASKTIETLVKVINIKDKTKDPKEKKDQRKSSSF